MSQVCVVTGSSRGIGLAIAKQLADDGHQVVLNSRSPLKPEVLEQFANAKLEVGTIVGDVSDFADAERMISAVKEQYGRIDVLVNNAGITRDGLVMRMKEEDFDQVIATNLKGCFNMARHTTPIMLKQRSGTIINVSSVSGIMGNAGQVNYAASKAGVIGLTKSLARELASRSITVNTIAPGFIETDMTAEMSERVTEAMLGEIPLKRFGQAEEVASAVKFLMENRYVTGQTIEVNGGLHI
ncbi:3-oxoacyl-[acyl-carrier-protein] reductase [Dolosigranulum pigrum]|uniref:3-oxoacyl-[acyl-carrier-protein] reductase n=1 Tax=Dolosigranulum pigrum TaxID=29394 RepID=A0A516GGS3_9LACT|nr:3-oxoacyl-[acyl-carrier-protein] reductase [Dolosigranulum pigrum]QDO90726.1 3-oxoacyl-[acyl-carrier-protein] reductase [Dolosigranulum pigrum]QTJ55637.1 3-oxoacyl-[acyl-carrier-protein] reductase [Dolosigranulum pigrum]